METWIKDRSSASLPSGVFGSFKPSYFGYPSLQAMTESEVETMNKARELYPFVPKVIHYDREKEQLLVEKVHGEHLDEYILRTRDLNILDRLWDAVKCLRSKEVSLQHRYEKHHKEGYLCYHDYHSGNFIVDHDGNLWLIDWDTAGLFPLDRLRSDDMAIKEFCRELRDLITE